MGTVLFILALVFLFLALSIVGVYFFNSSSNNVHLGSRGSSVNVSTPKSEEQQAN